MGIAFPAFAYDGRANYTLARPGEYAPDTVLVQPTAFSSAEDGALAFAVEAPPGRALKWTITAASPLPSRNGLVTPVLAELDSIMSDAPELAYSLRLVPWWPGK